MQFLNYIRNSLQYLGCIPGSLAQWPHHNQRLFWMAFLLTGPLIQQFSTESFHVAMPWVCAWANITYNLYTSLAPGSLVYNSPLNKWTEHDRGNGVNVLCHWLKHTQWVNQKHLRISFLIYRSLGPTTWSIPGRVNQGILVCSKDLQLILGFQEISAMSWKEAPGWKCSLSATAD